MSFNPNNSGSGAFEEAFEAWLNKSKTDDDNSDDDVLLIEPPNHSSDNFNQNNASFVPSPEEFSMPFPSPVEQPNNTRQNLVRIRTKSQSSQRYHAYKAVLKKYSRQRRALCKKSLSPGSQTDDSGVVSPGCDPALGNLKDVMNGESDGCLSGNDSPPNIQDGCANGWESNMSYHRRPDSECLDHPPELIPSHGVLEGITNKNSAQKSDAILSGVCSTSLPCDKRSTMGDVLYPFDSYVFSSTKEGRKSSRSRKHCMSPHPDSGRHKFMRSNGCHRHESPNQTYTSGDIGPSCGENMLNKKHDALCIERSLSEGVECDTASYVSRNGCEIGASDSGAGSQSESCCEESPRHEHDNLVSSGHIKTKSPQFSCDGHRFTVIPSDSTKKTSTSGSPPLVLKLKKCELKSNIKNSPPKYVAIEVSDSCGKPVKKPEQVEDEVFHSHSLDVHTCEINGSSRSKRSKAVRKSSADCSCCVGPRSSSRRKRHSRSLSDLSSQPSNRRRLSIGALQSNDRKFLRQSIHLSSLQTKVHTLFCHLFPRLKPLLSLISPEGRDFYQIIDDVITLLQQAETDDDKKDSEELSGEMEHLTLKGGNSVVPVFDPRVVLCRSPGLCLEEFREKVFLLVQLLLPELTLSIENNCYRSHRELEKFLDKIINANRTNV